jgi:hypothetical protein
MRNSETFLERTDLLAARLGVQMGELLPILEISRASFFSYRSGKRPISAKAWRKLEKAEREAGVATLREQLDVSLAAAEGASLDDVLSLFPEKARPGVRSKILEDRAEILRGDVHHFFEAVKALVLYAAKAAPLVERRDKELAAELRYFVVSLPKMAGLLKPRLMGLCDFMVGESLIESESGDGRSEG